jgi:DNA (cytosine-5)-methyltransferase 1
MSQLRCIDLFAGIGGMRLAFVSAGGRCVFSSEIDPWARKTYEANFGEVPAGDIFEIAPAYVPDHDVLLAGFPCQPFSMAGFREGFDSARGGDAFSAIVNVLEAKKPRAFLLENVPGLITHDSGKTIRLMLEKLGGLGYRAGHQIFSSKLFVPQDRRRVFIYGFGPDVPDSAERHVWALNPPFVVHDPLSILEPEVSDSYVIGDVMWRGMRRRHAAGPHKIHFLERDRPTRTLRATYFKDPSPILVRREGGNPRKLTPRECARLMGFPDSFKIIVPDSAAYRQFGNSVAVPLVAAIVNSVMRAASHPGGRALVPSTLQGDLS